MIELDKLSRRLAVGASLSLAIRVAGVLLMFAAHALLARALGVSDYGVFTYAISIVPVLALVAKSGFQFSSLRFLHEYGDSGQFELRSGYLRRSLQIPLVLSLALTAAVTAAGYLVPDLPDAIRESARHATWIVIFFTLATIAQQSLRALKKIGYSQVFEQIGLPLALIGFSGALLLAGASPGYRGAFAVYGGAYVAIAMIAWLLVGKFSGVGLSSPARYDTALWLKVAWPLAVAGVCSVLLSRLDIIMLGFFVGTEQIAFYSVSSRIAGLTIFCMAALAAIAGPYIAQYHKAGDRSTLTRLLRRLVAAALVVNGLFWIALWLFGDYLLLAFGAQYVDYRTLMLILAAGRLADFGLSFGGQLLSVSGHQKAYMLLLLAMTLLLCVALPVGIEWRGLTGAAIATAAVAITSNVLVFVQVRRCTGIAILPGR